MSSQMLGISINQRSKQDVLEKIKKYIDQPSDFFHIVSLNPENLILASKSPYFKEVVTKAQMHIIDGVGVVLAARFLGVQAGERTTGVDLMENLLEVASSKRLKVVLIGGERNIAEQVVKCQQSRFPGTQFVALQGIANISKPTQEEEERIFSIVTDTKPHIIFAAFGSPFQELWFYKNRHKLRKVVCMGVGGAFDYLSGRIPRAPSLARQIGLEWLFRLVVQPWRIRRQMRLINFIRLVVKEKIAAKG